MQNILIKASRRNGVLERLNNLILLPLDKILLDNISKRALKGLPFNLPTLNKSKVSLTKYKLEPTDHDIRRIRSISRNDISFYQEIFIQNKLKDTLQEYNPKHV